jgi:hypothetical protein
MRRLLLLLMLSSTALWAAQKAPQSSPAPAASAKAAAPASGEIVVPADTVIPMQLRSVINSRTAYPGQPIYCETIFPITVNDRIVIPVGSYVRGHVTQVVRPGRIKGRAKLGLTFDSLVLSNGTTRKLRASLSGFGSIGSEGYSPREGKIQGASTKGGDAGKVAQTTVRGAEVGTIAGAAGGNVGKGLEIGSLVGAAGGLIAVLVSRGKEIILPEGTNLDMQLSQPLSFGVGQIPQSSPRTGEGDRPPLLGTPGPGA